MCILFINIHAQEKLDQNRKQNTDEHRQSLARYLDLNVLIESLNKALMSTKLMMSLKNALLIRIIITFTFIFISCLSFSFCFSKKLCDGGIKKQDSSVHKMNNIFIEEGMRLHSIGLGSEAADCETLGHHQRWV